MLKIAIASLFSKNKKYAGSEKISGTKSMYEHDGIFKYF